MAALTKSGTPSLCTATPGNGSQLPDLLAGEAIAAGDACYIKSDGKVWLSTGAAANAAAVVDGFAAAAASVGKPVTLFSGVAFRYAAGMTPGVPYFLSGAVAGGLDTVASVGGLVPVARAIDATRLYVKRSW